MNEPGPRAHAWEAEPASVSGLVLRSAEFRKGREPGWRRLDELVSRIEKKGVGSLNAQEAQELPLLYRSAMSSLSVARTIALDRNLLLYLEDLALRAYLAVYGPRTGLRSNLVRFFRRDFPAAVRDMRRHLAAAALALAVGVLAGYLLVVSDLNYFHQLVPFSFTDGRGPSSTAEELLKDEIFAPWPGFAESFIAFAAYLFSHNTVVGLLAFGLSFAFGLPTVALLIYNGLILGAFIALHAAKGLTVDFLGWLSIHGVTEITAILLCGAAGLVVAEKILFPGPLSRLDSLALYGRKAAMVVAGTVPMFFIAGILEGGFRQLVGDTPARFALAALTLAFWLGYFMLAGRNRDGTETPAAGSPESSGP